MNSLKSISSEALIVSLQNLCGEERRVGIQILHHLREMENRGLHLERGYGSLHEFCVQVLKYTDGAAQRRIHAMRLLQALPEIEVDLMSGDLSLTNASLVQRVLPSKTTTDEQKRQWVQDVKGKTVREAEALLRAEYPTAKILTERTRVVGTDALELKLLVSRELLGKLDRLKEILAHQVSGAGYAELLEAMADQLLAEQVRKTSPRSPAPGKSKASAQKQAPSHRNPRSIRTEDRRHVFTRADNQCEYIDPDSGRRCASRFALQVDHRIAVAKNGTSDFENLQILCRSHNLKKAAA